MGREARPRRDAVGAPSGEPAERAQLLAQWSKERALGRRGFIMRRGVLTWGLPAAIMTIVYKTVQEQGFVRSPHLTQSLATAIVVALVVFPLCGWIFGRWLWDTGEARYRAMTKDG